MKTARLALVILMALAAFARPVSAESEPDRYAEMRDDMVRYIQRAFFGRERIQNPRVLEAMRTVPRHEFVPAELREQAYADSPLPIGHGQTISQPYIVAFMTDLLAIDEDSVVLEIGAGSGYHAAVVAQIAKEVYTIEIVEPLGKACEERLKRLEYDNIHVKIGDGYYGWEEHGPYDGIVVTAAASHVPPPLLEQLKPGGRMVIPVGPPFQVQHLMLVHKDTDGRVTQEQITPVRFVPFTRGEE